MIVINGKLDKRGQSIEVLTPLMDEYEKTDNEIAAVKKSIEIIKNEVTEIEKNGIKAIKKNYNFCRPKSPTTSKKSDDSLNMKSFK